MTALVTRLPLAAYCSPPMAIPINEDPYSYPPSYYVAAEKVATVSNKLSSIDANGKLLIVHLNVELHPSDYRKPLLILPNCTVSHKTGWLVNVRFRRVKKCEPLFPEGVREACFRLDEYCQGSHQTGKANQTDDPEILYSSMKAAYRLRRLQIDDPDDEPPPVPRYRPQSIATICAITKFTKREVQIMYRAFKQGCPCGTIMLQQFQEIYAQFFPQGNSNKYAEYVFKTFDRDEDGVISFEEFVVGLSIISRGTNTEKLEWIFDLYDINKRGCIRQTELMLVVQSIYELLGRHTDPPISKRAIADHVIDVFKRMDKNDDGVVTRQEFVDMCKNDKLLCDSLKLFDTRL